MVVLLWRDEMCISSPSSPFLSPLEIFPARLKIVSLCNRLLREVFNYLALIQVLFLFLF